MTVLFFETYENIPIEFYCVWDNIVTCISPYRRSTIGEIFEDLAMHTYVFGKPSSFLLGYQLLGVKYLVLRYSVTEGTFPRTRSRNTLCKSRSLSQSARCTKLRKQSAARTHHMNLKIRECREDFRNNLDNAT